MSTKQQPEIVVSTEKILEQLGITKEIPTMCNQTEAVNRTLDALQGALTEQIDFALDFYGTDEIAFYQPLTKSTWVLEQPYRGMTFEYEHAEFTLIQLCNIVQMLHGNAAEAEFVQELTARMKEQVTNRLQLRIEQEQMDRRLEWKWRREKEIEEAAI